MAIDYGSDFSGVTDLDAFLSVVAGTDPAGMTEAMIRRFDTDRGGLHYDESYGYNLQRLIADNIPPEVAEQLIVGEALKDERCTVCKTKITVQADGTWKVQINPQNSAGDEFDLVFLASAEKASLLTARQV